MNQGGASAYLGDPETRRFLIWSLAITGLCLVFIAFLRGLVGDFHSVHTFWHLIINQDYWGAWLTMGLLITAAAARSTAPALAVVGFFSRRPGITAVAAFVFFSMGTLLVSHDHPLSMDEYSARFQSEIFAGGHLAGKYPVALIDWLVPRQVQNHFLIVSRETGEVISTYLPGFALLLTPFTFLGIPWACNPAISAISLLALHKVASEVLSSKEAGGWAILFALASPVFTINAMSYYSMPAHLLLNLVYTLLLLRPTPGKAFVAGLVGGLALVLHNPLPHALYALPWVAWLLYRRDFRVVGMLVLGYLPMSGIGVGWIVFSSALQATASVVHEGGAAIGTAGDSLQAWLSFVRKVVTLPDMLVFLVRLAGTVKLWLWAVPGLLLLACLGFLSRSQNTAVRLLLASAVATFVGYFLIPFDQGQGWGYRYFHSAWGGLPILAAAAVVRPAVNVQPSTRLISVVGYLALSSLVLSTVLRLYQVEAFIGQHLKLLPLSDASGQMVTFVEVLETRTGYYTGELVRNPPRLQSKRVIMLSQGAERNAQLMREVDPSARRVTIEPWGETWQINTPHLRSTSKISDATDPR